MIQTYFMLLLLILYRAWKSTRSYSVGLQFRRHLFYCSTWISPCWLRHTGSTQIHIIPTDYEPRVTRGPQAYLSTLFLFLVFPKRAGKSTEFSRTLILRDAPRFTGEQAHWMDYKEKLDDFLFFHSSSLREICRDKRGQRSTCLFQMT